MQRYKMEDVDVDELRESIETFNNLVTRLPIDTYHNKIASLHIFQDWKNYVQRAFDHLSSMEVGKLFVKSAVDGTPQELVGTGTDGKEHTYTEWYIDQLCTIPLVDYSYLYNADGSVKLDPSTNRPIGDRWDYWTEDDFK